MPLFACSQCNTLENTARGDYWGRVFMDGELPICSECSTGTWHGAFEKTQATLEHFNQDPPSWEFTNGLVPSVDEPIHAAVDEARAKNA